MTGYIIAAAIGIFVAMLAAVGVHAGAQAHGSVAGLKAIWQRSVEGGVVLRDRRKTPSETPQDRS